MDGEAYCYKASERAISQMGDTRWLRDEGREVDFHTMSHKIDPTALGSVLAMIGVPLV